MHYTFANVKKALRYTPFLLKVLVTIKNPGSFFKGYLDNQKSTIHFYGETSMVTNCTDDISSISVIYIKDEYGYEAIATGAHVVVDIGANIGTFTIKAASNPLNKVYAYEPMGKTYAALTENISRNALPNIVSYNLGVAGKNEVRDFSFASDKSILSSMVFKPGTDTLQVACCTLADIFTTNAITKIDFLKMDCEGAEFEILYNTTPDILAKIHYVRMEYHDLLSADSDTANIDSLVVFMEGNNFSLEKKEAAAPSLGIAWFRNKSFIETGHTVTVS